MKRSIAAIAAAAALALSGCGSATDTTTGTSKSASQTTSQTPTPTTAAAGETVDFQSIAAESAAAVKAKKTAHMTMSMGKEGTLQADVDYAGTSPRMKMTLQAEGDTMQMIYIDQVMYMGGPMFAQMTGGKKWIKIDPKGTDPMSKSMGPMLGQIESSLANPIESIAALKDVKATVKSSDGSATTYTITLTKAQIEAMAKAQGAPGVSGDALSGLPASMAYDYTIDADKLPQKMSMTLSGESMDMTFTKWGEPVDVSAPAASEVGTFTMPTS